MRSISFSGRFIALAKATEYLDTEDLDEKERKRWEDCYKKYLEIREALSKKTVYNKKMYGLFVDYNALQNMSQTGNLMNTYY